MSQPAYDVLLVAHVLSAVLGFGAIAIAGGEASSARRSADPASDEGVRRFFKPGRDWPARTILFVPVLGLGLLFGGDRPDVRAVWPWIGLGIWVVAVGVATAVCWPAERSAQLALSALVDSGAAAEATPADGSPEAPTPLIEDFRSACRRMELAAGAISLCFFAAVVVMVAQPK
jgi:hypothetical protein